MLLMFILEIKWSKMIKFLYWFKLLFLQGQKQFFLRKVISQGCATMSFNFLNLTHIYYFKDFICYIIIFSLKLLHISFWCLSFPHIICIWHGHLCVFISTFCILEFQWKWSLGFNPERICVSQNNTTRALMFANAFVSDQNRINQKANLL